MKFFFATALVVALSACSSSTAPVAETKPATPAATPAATPDAPPAAPSSQPADAPK